MTCVHSERYCCGRCRGHYCLDCHAPTVSPATTGTTITCVACAVVVRHRDGRPSLTSPLKVFLAYRLAPSSRPGRMSHNRHDLRRWIVGLNRAMSVRDARGRVLVSGEVTPDVVVVAGTAPRITVSLAPDAPAPSRLLVVANVGLATGDLVTVDADGVVLPALPGARVFGTVVSVDGDRAVVSFDASLVTFETR